MPAEMPDRGCVYEETRECTHDYHVACTAAAGPSAAFPEGVVLTGTYDYTSSGTVKQPATVKLWGAKDGADKGSLLGHTATVSAVAVAVDEGCEILSGSWDKTIKVYHITVMHMM